MWVPIGTALQVGGHTAHLSPVGSIRDIGCALAAGSGEEVVVVLLLRLGNPDQTCLDIVSCHRIISSSADVPYSAAR